MKRKPLGLILLVVAIALPSFALLLQVTGAAKAFSALASLLSPLLIGICVAFVVNIPMSALERRILKLSKTKKRATLVLVRGVSILFSIILVVCIFALVLVLIIPETKHAILQLINNIPEYMSALSEFFSRISELLHLAPSENTLDWSAVRDTLRDVFLKYGSGIINATVDAAFGLIQLITTAVLSLIIAIYLLASKENIFAGLARLCLAFFSNEATKKFFSFLRLVSDTFRSYITGQLTEAVILGSLCFLGMTVFSFPYAVMTASLVAVTALVPVFGALIGAAGGALMILTVSPTKAFWFLVFILILQQLENNLIYPRVVGKSVGLPAMWVLVSATAGGALLGVGGLLAGVPIASVIYSLASSSKNEAPTDEPSEDESEEEIEAIPEGIDEYEIKDEVPQEIKWKRKIKK